MLIPYSLWPLSKQVLPEFFLFTNLTRTYAILSNDLSHNLAYNNLLEKKYAFLIVFSKSTTHLVLHWTKMYPMTFMCLFPLSALYLASFPHVLLSSCLPPVPNPILESQVMQSFSLLPRKPILALERSLLLHTALNPSLLQLRCKDACEPIRSFHVLRPSEVGRYCPSAISECMELACLSMTRNFVWWPTLIPRQILENGVLQ